MPKPSIALSHRGLSLPEVAIAVLVLGLTIAPIFMVMSRGSTGTIQTRDEILAYHYADELLAYLQTRPYNDPDLAVVDRKSFPRFSLPRGSGNLQIGIDPTRFERYLTVVERSPGANWPWSYKILLSEVNWKTGGLARQIRISALVPKER